MMREDHPLAGRPMTMKHYLDAEHLAPTPYAVGQRGVVDLHLARERLKRNIVAWVPYFNLAPYMLMESDMIFTCPRSFAEHFARLLPVALARSPIEYPPMAFYLLWHDRAHYAEDCRWFHEQIVAVARASTTPHIRALSSTPTEFRMPALVSCVAARPLQNAHADASGRSTRDLLQSASANSCSGVCPMRSANRAMIAARSRPRTARMKGKPKRAV